MYGATPPKQLHKWWYTRPGALFKTEEACKNYMAGDNFKLDLEVLAEVLAPLVKQFPNANVSWQCEVPPVDLLGEPA